MSEIRGGLPAGGIGLGPEEYAEFVSKEHLGDYVRAGGAAVRFIVAGSDEVAVRWHRNLASIADADGYLCVGVDAADHRVHLIDQLFAAVARQVDWCDLARRQVRAGWESLGLPPPEPGGLAVATVAAHHDVAVPEAARSMRRHLEAALLRDPSLDREFRLAVLRLCQYELGTGDVFDTERDAVLAWLRVEPVTLRLLKSAALYGRVARHNARSLLVSLAAWRARVTGSGLVLDVDLSRLAVGRRGQSDIEDRFSTLIGGIGRVRTGSRGLLLGGGFGAGKSHVLEHLAHLALDRGYAVSRIVVSKETPLHDPAKVLRAAVESAVLSDGSVGAVAEAAAGLDPDGPAFAELMRWAGGSGAPVDEWFPVTLTLFPRVQAGEDNFADAIVRFWSGDRLAVTEVRRHAKFAGLGRPALAAVPARELPRQRFRFLARLLAAAGCEGWVLLFDEVELIGRYTVQQRGRSYAELARWLQPDADDPASPMATVLAMTDDFDAAVLTAKNDRAVVPAKLRAKQSGEWDEIATRAETAMGLIEGDMLLLSAPDAGELDYAYQRLKALHSEAFGWNAPDVAGLERLGTTRMRQYVRAWINEWDLVRIDPSYRPRTEVAPITFSYAEQPDLDVNTEDPDRW